MYQQNKSCKQVKKISDFKQQLFLLVRNGEELPTSPWLGYDDDVLEIDGLEDDNK